MSASAPGRFGAILDLIRFDRPVGWILLFLPSGWAILAARPGNPLWFWLAVFLFGSFLTRSAGCVVNDLFDRIEQLKDKRHLKSVSVRYDPVLGYPQQITVTCQSNVIDCGVTYEMRSVVH